MSKTAAAAEAKIPATMPTPGDNAVGKTADTNEAGKTPDTKLTADENVTILSKRSDIPMPSIKSNRGSKSKYDLASLNVGESIGIIGRKAKSLASTISGANRSFAEPKKDANGQIVYKTTETKDANGVVTGRVPTTEPEKVLTRRFVAIDCDPAKDPEKATVRIWRES